LKARTIAALTVAVTALVAHKRVASAFRGRSDAMIGRLVRAMQTNDAQPMVPAIVSAFAQRARSDGGVPIVVRLSQTGDMRANPGDHWRTFTATQTIAVREPGFLWLARMRILPCVFADILDGLTDGNALLEVRLFGSIRLARSAGPDVARGEVMRYLAELPWAPWAMVQNRHLSWREIDANTIEVSAPSPGGPAKVRLIFENGDVAGIEADDRPRSVSGRTIPTRWQGRFFDYRQIGGCRIPTRAVVSWLLDDGPFDCWRGIIIQFEAK
jgi:uncharacterized protein DUF6544